MATRCRTLTLLLVMHWTCNLPQAVAEDFFAQEIGTEWQFVSGTQDYLQSQSTSWYEKGFRISNLEMFSDSGQLRFLATFIPNPDKLQFRGEWNQDGTTFWKKHSEYTAQGMMLIDIELAYIGGQWKFAGVWLQNRHNLQTKLDFGKSLAETENLVRARMAEDYSPVDIEVTMGAGQQEITLLWVKGLNRTCKVVWNRSAQQLDDEVARLAEEGYRPIDIDTRYVGGSQKWAAIFITGNKGEKWEAKWGMKWPEFQQQNSEFVKKGLRPYAMTECQAPDCACYSCVWFAPAAAPPAVNGKTSSSSTPGIDLPSPVGKPAAAAE